MKTNRRKSNFRRTGAVSVLVAFMMVIMLCLVAFSIDLGYLMMANAELQRTADCAAIAATWELIDDDPPGTAVDLTSEINQARTQGVHFASLNKVCQSAPSVDLNGNNSATGDIVVGYLSDPSDRACQMTYGNPNQFNAVKVHVSRSATRNGEVPLFFARILGLQSQAMDAQATAALLNNVGGFRAPGSGGNVDLLPFALDQTTWDDMLAGGGSDNWSWDDADHTVVAGADGIREVNLYPQGTGSPGNRGTVDIGGSNNSTNDIARQITDGVSADDLAHFDGGELKFDEHGELDLNGDTGISAGVKDELASIMGQPRMIPVFAQVTGPGNNATYTIVQFVGIRIMDVKLTGSNSSKRVIVQPARVLAAGALPGGETTTSQYIYSPVWLVR